MMRAKRALLLAHPPVFQEMYGASDISSVQAEGVSGHNRKTVVPSWVRPDHSCFLYRGVMGEILLLLDSLRPPPSRKGKNPSTQTHARWRL